MIRRLRPGHGGRVKLLAGAALTLAWVLMWGTYSPMSVAGGIVLAVAVLVLFPLPHLGLGVTVRPWPLLVLIGRFLADLVTASIHVAYLAVAPWKRPHGHLVDVELRSDDELFVMLTAELTALVPGSVVIDVVPSERRLVLHILDATPEELPARAEAVRAQEARLLRAIARDADSILEVIP